MTLDFEPETVCRVFVYVVMFIITPCMAVSCVFFLLLVSNYHMWVVTYMYEGLRFHAVVVTA